MSLGGCGGKPTTKPVASSNNSTKSTPVKLDIVTEDVTKIELPWSPINEQESYSAILKNFVTGEITVHKFEKGTIIQSTRDGYILQAVNGNYSLTKIIEPSYEERKKKSDEYNEYIKSVGEISNDSKNFIGVSQNHSLWILTSSDLYKKSLYISAKDLQTGKRYKLPIASVDAMTGSLSPIGGVVSDNIIWVAFTSIKPDDKTSVVAAWTFTPGDGFHEIISKNIVAESLINRGNNVIITKDKDQEDTALVMFTEATQENPQLLEWKQYVRVLRCKLTGYSGNK